MSSKKFNTSRVLYSLAVIAVLLLASPTVAKISRYEESIDPFTFTGSNNHYQYSLNAAFDFSEAKYPITIKADGLGANPGYTYQDSVTNVPGKSDFKNLETLFIVNHNNLIVSGFKDNAEHTFVDLIQCGSPESINNFNCNPESVKFDKTVVGVDHKLEATRFDERAGLYVTVWRNSKTNELVIYVQPPPNSSVTSSNDVIEYIKMDLKNSQTEEIYINNRARLELNQFDKVIPDPEREGETKTIKATQVFVFDHMTGNGKDAPNSQYLLVAEITGTAIGESKDYKIAYDQEKYFNKLDDTHGQLKTETISTIYEHEGELFVSSEKNGDLYTGLKCLTRIADFDSNKFTLAPPGYGYFCADIPNGAFFGMSNGNELFQLMINENSQELRIYTLNDSSKPTLDGNFVRSVKINTPLQGKTGIREILSGTDAYTIRFATDKGIDDTGANTLTIIRTNDLEDEFSSKEGQVDIVINQINLTASTTQTDFKILAQPFIFFVDTVLKDGTEVNVDIIVEDADKTPITVKASFTRYDKALAAVKLKSYNPVPVEIDPNSLTRHYFPYDNILLGNSVKLEVTQNEGTPISNLVAVNHQYQRHYVTLPESSTSKREQFMINSGAAILVDGMSNTINYYKCDAENSFSTQCMISEKVPTHGITFHKHLGATTGVTMTIGHKEIENADGKKRTFYYFNWFDHDKKVWDYEVYDKKIVDVGHTITKGGETYTIIAFEDSIQIGRFFSGWTYGNRDVKVFNKDDVDIDNFCPSNVMFNAQQRNVIYVLSNCDNSQNLVQFEIEDPRSPKFSGSRWISSEAKPSPKKSCVLPDELIIFGESTESGQANTLTAYDRNFSFTKSTIDTGIYEISNFYEFACLPELNVFLTLNDNSDGQAEQGMKELVIYRGGAAMQGMRRILFRIYNLPSTITSFRTYTHLDKVAVLFLDDNKEIIYMINVDINNPTLATQADVAKENWGKTLKLNIKATNPNQIVDQTNGDLIILESLGTEKPVIRGDKNPIAIGNIDINSSLQMQNTPIVDCDLIADGKEVTEGQKITGIVDSDKSALSQITQKVGNYQRFGAYDVVSYYKDSSASTLEFGKMEIYRENESSGYTRTGILYLPNTLRYTNSLVDGNYIYTAIVSNEGVGSSLKLTLAYQGKLSKTTFSIDDYNFYHRADIFLKRKLETSENKKTVELVVVAYSKLQKILTAHKVTVTLNGDETNDIPPQDNWEASVDESEESSNPVYRIQDYDYVDKASAQIINFYIVTEGNEPSVGRITYNKATGEFVNDDPLKTIKFEAGEKKDSQIYGIGCSRLDIDAEQGNDRCAFSTYGAVVYYAEMDNNDETPTSSSSTSVEANMRNNYDGPGSRDRIEEGLNQEPSKPTVKMNRVLRLRRINQNFGKNVFVLNNNVILETERITHSQTKAALVWDVTNYGGEMTKDVGVNQVVSLTLDQSSGPQSQYDSVLVSAIPVEKDGIPLPEFDMVVLNEVKNAQQQGFTYEIGMKRLSNYVLEVSTVPDATLFSKLRAKCTSINGHIIEIPISDFLDMPAANDL